MLSQTFIAIFDRDLNKLKEEINAYADESRLWHTEKGISNSAGNLSLHLVGNLNHFIGATLGNTGYVRTRDVEFADKNVPRTKVVADIDNTIVMIRTVLGKMSDEDFEKTYAQKLSIGEVTTSYFIIHLISHLSYHLGQINYHRRLLDAK
jgi:uncharacterized damage-inducible protein DinB